MVRSGQVDGLDARHKREYIDISPEVQVQYKVSNHRFFFVSDLLVAVEKNSKIQKFSPQE